MNTAQYRTTAGMSLIGGGALTILGFTTAASLYPGYSISEQTISALGAAGATPASQDVFNTVMIVSGGLLLIAAYALHHVFDYWPLTSVLAVTGIGGLVGVGVFPAHTGLPHMFAALTAFGGVGVTALMVAVIVRGPFWGVSMLFGVAELFALGVFLILNGATPLGTGGLERWVAYLGLVWAIAFGGVLLPSGRTESR